MRCGFSEFTYGFAYTFEVANTLAGLLPGAPILPNLQAEGSLGWDVRLDGLHGWTYFAQFKIPEMLTRSNASEWDYWAANYFRFATRDMSRQHELLLELEAASVFNVVSYVCPCFGDVGSLNQAFTTASIEARSLKLRPSEIGPGAHVVTFDAWGNYLVFSEPRSGFASPTDRTVSNLSGLLTSPSRPSARAFDDSYFNELSERVLEFAGRVGSRDLMSRLSTSSRRRDRESTDDTSTTSESFSELALLTRLLFDGQVFAVPDTTSLEQT